MQARHPAFISRFCLKAGEIDDLHPHIQRILAPNPGPMTFTGTLTYLVGHKNPVLIDPGPMMESHLQAILTALDGRALAGILLTHHHGDHDGLTHQLRAATGARLLEAKPGCIWQEGEVSLQAIASPGHSADHYCYWLADEKILFSGDHVMNWSTSMVEDMGAYMQSLEQVMALKPQLLLPGHGPERRRPGAYLRALKTHRLMRERAILVQYQKGHHDAELITRNLYPDLSPGVFSGALATTRAHLIHLAQQGKIALESPIPTLRKIEP